MSKVRTKMPLPPSKKGSEQSFSSRFQSWNDVDTFLIVGITLLAFTLRMTGIDAQGLWHDELYTLGNLVGFDLYLFPGSDLAINEAVGPAGNYVDRLSQDLFWPNLWRNMVHEGHPPLYLLLVKVWTLVSNTSPYTIRLFSVITSTLAVPFVFLAGMQLGGRKVAIFAVLLLATSPFQVYFSTQARSYSLLAMLAAATTFTALILHDTRNPSRLQWSAWILCASAMCLTHYFAVIYCFLLLIFLIFPSIKENWNTRTIGSICLALIPLFILSAWLPVLYLQVTAHGSGHWTQGRIGIWPSLENTLYGFLELLAGPPIISPRPELIFLVVLFAISVVVIFWRPRRPHSHIPLLFLLMLPLHALLVFVADIILNHHTITVPRYSSSLAIPLTLILAYTLSRLRGTGVALALIFSLTTIHGAVLTSRGDRAPRQMLIEVATYINQNSKQGDIVVVTPNGPTLIGVALYLKPDTLVTAIPASALVKLLNDNDRQPEQTIWNVQQRLGLSYESWSDSSTPPPQSLIRFAGVDLAKY